MKIYETRIISNPKELDSCEPFIIDNVQWTNIFCPKSFGRMAFLPKVGIMVKMYSDETNPLHTVSKNMVNVCQDSVMEAFFAFPDEMSPLDLKKRPDDNGMYFNFEINPNGALYAKTGRGRSGRQAILPEELIKAMPKAFIDESGWGAEFIVPISLLERLVSKDIFIKGGEFYCNFYKMSENPKIEHYISYSPIASDTPNFHLPSSFAKAVLI